MRAFTKTRRHNAWNGSRWSTAVISLFLMAATLSGCGRSDRLPVYAVEGSVLHEGKPTVGALVVFHPENPSDKMKKLRPTATVGAEGKSVLSTYEPKDGAPEGEYRVTVYWPGPGQSGEGGPGPDRLKKRYAIPQTTTLRATVPAEDATLDPFDLQ